METVELEKTIATLQETEAKQRIALYNTISELRDVKKAAGMCVCVGWHGHDADCPEWEMPF